MRSVIFTIFYALISQQNLWKVVSSFFFFFFFFLLVFFSTTHVSHSFPLSTFFFFFFQIIPDHFFSSLSISLSLASLYLLFLFLLLFSFLFSSLLTHTHTQPTWPSSIFFFFNFFLSCSDSLCCYNGAQIGFHALDLLFLF